jgi:hypothetical protein
MNCFIDERIKLYRFAKPRKSVINFYFGLLMNSSPKKLIQLSVLLFAFLGTISCNKENDLMAEYVLSASLTPQEATLSTSENFNGTDVKNKTIIDALTKESTSAAVQLTESVTQKKGSVAIDDLTNTIIYTPAAENPVSTLQAVGAVGK